jgi:hypothetical protein
MKRYEVVVCSNNPVTHPCFEEYITFDKDQENIIQSLYVRMEVTDVRAALRGVECDWTTLSALCIRLILPNIQMKNVKFVLETVRF